MLNRTRVIIGKLLLALGVPEPVLSSSDGNLYFPAFQALQRLQLPCVFAWVCYSGQVNECVDVKEAPGLSAVQHQEMVAALARKEVEMSAAMQVEGAHLRTLPPHFALYFSSATVFASLCASYRQDALADERQRTEQLIAEALKSFADAQRNDPNLEARIAALEVRADKKAGVQQHLQVSSTLPLAFKSALIENRPVLEACQKIKPAQQSHAQDFKFENGWAGAPPNNGR
eukprot:1158309-Pelagomonas_calceolata.AAC.6